jgi:hypothetical protein
LSSLAGCRDALIFHRKDAKGQGENSKCIAECPEHYRQIFMGTIVVLSGIKERKAVLAGSQKTFLNLTVSVEHRLQINNDQLGIRN